MQTSQRARDLDRLYASRRGHAPQLSISDDNHDVTEAIGDMYGSFEDPNHHRRQFRPLSFVSAPFGETIETSRQMQSPTSPRSPLARIPSHERSALSTSRSPHDTAFNASPTRSLSPDDLRAPSTMRSPPPPLHNSPSDTATQQFPLNDLDYESSPAAVAQELSNLQAIRRMSMDVSGMGMDPDLPAFSSISVPSVQPRKDTGEEDPNLLFWVPARLHPELAPKEFKTFVQDRVKTIKRSSLSESPMSLDTSKSDSLRRRKSMLSRQVDDGVGYLDGAERLERKKSQSGSDVLDGPAVHLQDLEALVDDPMGAMRSLTENTARRSLESTSPYEVPASEDLPILGPKPVGATLKRSTRTQYRRGSLKKGERLAPGRRLAMKQGEGGEPTPVSTESSPVGEDVPQLPDIPDLYSVGLMRVNSAPVSSKGTVENFSRPGRRMKVPGSTSPDENDVTKDDMFASSVGSMRKQSAPPTHFPPRGASTGRTVAKSSQPLPVPTIVETPPVEPQSSGSFGPLASQATPERQTSPDSTSQPPSQGPQQPLPHRPGAQRPALTRPGSLTPRKQPAPTSPEERAAQAQQTVMNNQRTDALSIVPITTEEKRPEKKIKEKKDESRKGSWGWFSSKEDDKKEKEKEDKKSKSKLQKGPSVDKSHDSARLDVLQASIDGPQARESLVLDRRNIQVEEETPSKKVTRKTSSEKKEKDGLFSTLFGGGKKKGDKDGVNGKKGLGLHRGLSPDPPARILRPDVDYNWSRFSILEERAIYRMAHIKLANPRRELYSQVLLSNFMYSYLAKVQQMHPQLQVPQSAAQKREMEEKKRQQEVEKKQEAERQRQQQSGGSYEEFANYQRYQEQQQPGDNSPPSAYGFDNGQHDGGNDESEASPGPVGGYSASPQINRYGGQAQQGATNFSGPIRGNQNGTQQQQQQQHQQQAAGYSNGMEQKYNGANGGGHHQQQQRQRQPAKHGQTQHNDLGMDSPRSADGNGGTPNYLGSLGAGIGKGGQKPLFTFDSEDDDEEEKHDEGRRAEGYGRSNGAVGSIGSRNGRW